MTLKLSRPIVVFDLETTGTNLVRDRIVEISILKVYPDGLEEVKTRRINPGMPIPAEATAIHGISDEDVRDCPTFARVARNLYDWIADCDLVGFNSNRFDVPLLAEEFLRAGITPDFHERELVDVQTIFHKMEPRTLSAGYRFYCGKTLENAHSAEADTRATYEVLKAQVERYPELTGEISDLAKYSHHSNAVDYAGMIVYNDAGEETINFGKYRGQTVESVLKRDPGYYSWVLNAEFTLDTKSCFTRLYLKSQEA